MAFRRNTRLTLRVSQTTNIERAIERIEQVLLSRGIDNPALSKLVLDTAQRFKGEVSQPTTINTAASSGVSGVASGNSMIRGEGYRILITTRPETALSRFIDQLLRRPAAIT